MFLFFLFGFTDIENVIDVTPNPVKPCDREDYRAYWYGCYKVHKSSQSWDTAKTMCIEEGGNLVTIIAEAENAAMQLATSEDDLPVWTGGRDLDVGRYKFCSYPKNSANDIQIQIKNVTKQNYTEKGNVMKMKK